MSIYIGDIKVSRIYLGPAEIAAAYHGGVKVFEKGGSRLPSGYTEVAYLENTGSSVMRIGFCNNPRYSIHAKFGQNAVNRGFVCATNTSHSPYLYSYYDASHDLFTLNVSRNGSNLTSKTIYTPLDTSVHTVEYLCVGASQVYRHNGAQVATSSYDMSGADDDTLQLSLFGRNKGPSSSDYSYRGRIYEFWISDGDTRLVELVPCVRDSDSQPGMYDIVRNMFITGGTAIVAPPTNS